MFCAEALLLSNIDLSLNEVVTFKMVNILQTLGDFISMKPPLGIKIYNYRGITYAISTNIFSILLSLVI